LASQYESADNDFENVPAAHALQALNPVLEAADGFL
jgi:hypothetical protein